MFIKKDTLYVIVVIGISLIGAGLRLYFFGVNRSLWLDEAMLALNIVNRSWIELFKPLDFNQGTPVGFLLTQKFISSFFGNYDYVLRIIPLIAGISALPLMYLVATRYLRRGLPALFALSFVALSPRLIYYSSEVKQYATDVLATLIILFVAHASFDQQAHHRTFVTLGLVGALLIWFSHPALFVLAGVGGSLGVMLLLARDQRRLGWLVLVIAGWMLSFGVSYLISLRQLTANQVLTDYWRSGFAPLPPWNHLAWYYDTWLALLNDPATLPATSLTLGLLILGAVSLFQRRWPFLLLIVGTFGLTLVASALERYPFSGRLILFVLPLLALLLAEALDWLYIKALKIHPWVAVGSILLITSYLLSQSVMIVANNVASPPLDQHIKPIMSYLRDQYRASDRLYLYYSARPAFHFYAPMYHLDQTLYINGVASRDDPSAYIEDLAQLKGNERVWVVFSHVCSWCIVDERQFMLEYLDSIGHQLDAVESNGSWVYLYALP